MEMEPGWNYFENFLVWKLGQACDTGDLALAKEVLEAAKEAKDKNGDPVVLNMQSCFEAAVESRHFEVAQYLLDNDHPWNSMVFGFYEYVSGIYSAEREGIQTDEMNDDPTDIFRFYIEHDVDINLVCAGGTALDYAIRVGYPVIEKALRDFGGKCLSELTEAEIQAQMQSG